MFRLNPDGTWTAANFPSVPELTRHAEKFGVECIAETAALWLNVEELTELIERLDLIETAEDSKRRYSRVTKRRKSPEERAKALLGIDDSEAEEAE